MLGYGWFPLRAGTPCRIRPRSRRRAASVEAFLDEALARYPSIAKRLVVAGFSQGGFLAYQIALRAPQRFAGLMALSSWLPAGAGRARSRRSRRTASCPRWSCTAATTR